MLECNNMTGPIILLLSISLKPGFTILLGRLLSCFTLVMDGLMMMNNTETMVCYCSMDQLAYLRNMIN
jgi:hypothetical protein